ncbi:MAG: cytochrome P460 family protein [Rhodospirillales bacterium]|nr:cytochrome P460 family protein [Rhodospirillales bacterium]
MAVSQGAKINTANETSIPEKFREWVFLGAPLTPNGLNGGAAGFPEFHHVYIEPGAYAEFKKTGVFPEGTTIVKELVLLHQGEYEDGSRDEASGRGFFADRFAGIDMMVKDTKRFADNNGWGFFNFGHHEPPYAEKAAAAPTENCAACHTANATHDMVFTKFYPILGRK